VAASLQVLHRVLHEREEARIQVARLRDAPRGRPVDDLRAAVRELGDRERLRLGSAERVRERQLGSERVEQPSDPHRLPPVRNLRASAEVVAERDARYAPQQLLAQLRVDVPQLLHERPLTLHVAVAGEHVEVDRRAPLVGPLAQGPRSCRQRGDVAEVGVGVALTVLQLAQGAVVVVQADAAADLDADVRVGHVLRQRVRVGRRALPDADLVHSRPQVHAPDRLGAQLADVEPQLRRAEVLPPTGHVGQQVVPVGCAVGVVEHVVLALVPHEALEPPAHALLVERLQRALHVAERQRVELEALRLDRVPVAAERGAARRDLDDGDRRRSVLGDLAREAQLGPDHAAHRLQRGPPVRGRLVLAPDAVPEADLLLRRAQAGERREPLDVRDLRVRADHVGLAREDEDAHRLVVLALGRRAS